MPQTREAKAPARPDAAVPEGAVAYAIGDIHGCADLLAKLLEQIVSEAGERPEDGVSLVGLGDYVDRGADSKGVIDMLLGLSASDGVDCCFLRGNHDQLLLDFLEKPDVGPEWCDFGGRETLICYGAAPPHPRAATEEWAATRDLFRELLPAEHLSFLQDLKPSHQLGDYFFAHAGARPGVPLEEQRVEDLLWIRQPFLKHPDPFEKVVVHGHTPAVNPHLDGRRIGLDTGAYATGVLSAIRLENQDRRLVQVRRAVGGELVVSSQEA
jgi:serine/threonine protein phosphatase 1